MMPTHPRLRWRQVTIIPRSNGAGGFTIFTPDDEQLESGLYSKRYLLNQIAVALGGRVAEEIVFGEEEVTTGASNDLQQVRRWAVGPKNVASSTWASRGGGAWLVS